jgi:hypothetical protein
MFLRKKSMKDLKESSTYARLFQKISIKNNQELKDPDCLYVYRSMGFVWIRRPDFKGLNWFIRNPTVGFPVELYPWPYPGCYHIDSPRGIRLRTRMCFF